jgi:hypothetical protein
MQGESMKKYIPTLALLLCSSAFSQSQNKEISVDLPIKCYPKETVMGELEKNFKEKIVFAGIEEQLNIPNVSSFLTLNQETETYTFGFYIPNRNIMCIVSSGMGAMAK